MSLTDIESFLESHEVNLDIDPLFDRYCLSHSDKDFLGFAQFLADEGVVDIDLAQELMAELAVEVTDLNILGEFYDQTLMADRRQQTQQQQITGDLLRQSLGKSSHILLEQIGAGAMGSIHLAQDRFLRRTVAFKKLLENIQLTEADLQRFLSEVQITAQLDHPHVVPIYNLENNINGEIAYSMKVVRGRSLKAWLADVRAAYQRDKVPQNFQLKGRLSIFLKICDALAYAHSRGIIHRDLKPANIMLGSHNEVYVMDWGIARPFALDESEQTQVEVGNLDYLESEVGQVVGTPRYMSPEQAAGMNNQLNHLSDQFALGLILFEMVTLTQAIQGKKTMEVIKKVIKRDLEPLVHRNGEKIPEPLKAIIKKATARRRKDRYPHTSELAADLRRYLRDEPVRAQKETALAKLLRQVNRYRAWILVGILGCTALAAGTTTGIFYYKQQALAATELRRQAMGQYLSDLANQSQRINGQFLRWEQQLQALTAATHVSLIDGMPEDKPIYQIQNIDQAQGDAAGFSMAPAFGKSVSVLWPAFKLPNSTDAIIQAQKLLPLRHPLQQLFLENLEPLTVKSPWHNQVNLLKTQEVPLLQAFVTLPTGLTLYYPGQKEPHNPPAAASALANKKNVPIWAKPNTETGYVAVIQTIPGREKASLGEAGLFFRLSGLKPYLKHPGMAIKGGYLISRTGNIYCSSDPLKGNFFSHFESAKPLQDQVAAGKKSGYLITPNEDVFAFSTIEGLNWLYVQHIPLETILAPFLPTL